MLQKSKHALLRVFVASAFAAGTLLLAACTPAPTTPIAITVTATDATSTVDVDRSTTMSFTVTNPGSDRVDKVFVYTRGDGLSSLQAFSFTCSARGTTCPEITEGANIARFDMPAGASLTFVADARLTQPAKGAATLTFTVASVDRTGYVEATSHATAVDGREGSYRVFAASGLQANVDVQYATAPGPMSFTVSTGSVDKTATFATGLYTFPSGGHVTSAPGLLVGQADFGSGLDTFIAASNLVTALSDLDGTTFSTFSLMGAAAGATPSTGPLLIDQVAISGSTLTRCTFAVGPIATCDPAFLQHFALTKAGGPVITASGTDNTEVFTFQVARSGTSLVLLRADKDAQGHGVFAMGLSNAQAPTAEVLSLGTTDAVYGGPAGAPGGTAGAFASLDMTPTTLQFWPLTSTGVFTFPAYTLTFAGTDDGIAGLLHATRPTDGVEVFVLKQGPLTLVATQTGEFGIATSR